METLLTSKQELIDWISTIEDPETLMILKGIKHEATFNFEEEWKKGISLEDFRTEMLRRVRNYPWKKNGSNSE